ncbi:putative biofilm formation methyltransferase WspC [compost metagenome]
MADGLLFVGPAETSLLTARRLPAVPIARSFAFRAQALPPPAAAPAPPAARPLVHSWTPPRRPVRQAPAPGLPLPPAVAPAGPAMEPDAQASLRRIAALADQGRVRDAMAQCRAHIDTHGASAEALYLQGLLQDAAGDARLAQAAYRKALYLDPTHREALLHLAALVASDGDHEGARRLQARAAREEARRE